MTVADPAGDAPAAGDRDGLPRRGFSASCGTRAGTFGGPGSFAKSLPTTSHSGSSAPSPGNDLLKLRWKPAVRVGYEYRDPNIAPPGRDKKDCRQASRGDR